MAKIKSSTKSQGPAPIFSAFTATDLGDFRAAKQELSRRFLGTGNVAASRGTFMARAITAISPAVNDNVVGVGIGEKLVDDKATGVRAVKILVKLKYPESQIDRKNLLPKSISGLPVDVEQTGEFRRFAKKKKAAPASSTSTVAAAGTTPNPRTKIRPAQPGSSVGYQDPNNRVVMAGTFGAVVTQGNDLYILSNNHVLADEGQLPIGSPIFQPGLLDGGNAATDSIAELTKFEPLVSGTLNPVDCAIARVLKPNLVTRDILFIGPPQGSSQAQIDMIVHKFGRTTSYRVGRVTSVDTDVSVGYETGTFTFGGQIIIVGLNGQPFSDSGDSGSLILDRATQNAVGLLFAGSTTHTIANHITDVLKTLGVALA